MDHNKEAVPAAADMGESQGPSGAEHEAPDRFIEGFETTKKEVLAYYACVRRAI